MNSRSDNKILFIAIYFPPVGGPGVNRSIQFVKNLPENDYQPVVLTIKKSAAKQSSYPEDPTLLDEIPENIIVERVPSGSIAGIRNVLMTLKLFRIFWFFLYPLFWDSFSIFPFTAFKKAESLIRKHKIRTIYTTSGPFSNLLLGYMLKIFFKINWVADLRDPFTDGYSWQYPSKLHWFFSRVIEKRLLSKTDQLIVNTEEVSKLYIERGWITKDRINVITNGF